MVQEYSFQYESATRKLQGHQYAPQVQYNLEDFSPVSSIKPNEDGIVAANHNALMPMESFCSNSINFNESIILQMMDDMDMPDMRKTE